MKSDLLPTNCLYCDMNDINLKQAVRYHYGKFPPELESAQFVDELIAAAEALGRYDQMLLSLPNPELLLAPLRRKEAVLSSRIEGTVSTIEEVMKYEANANRKNVADFTRVDVIETYLYSETLATAQKQLEESYPIDGHLIKSMHQNLLKEGRGASKSPGQYKQEQNYLVNSDTGEVKFVPMAPEHTEGGIESLLKYMKENGTHPLLKIAVAHLEFEAIHPFKDGNGRIGRILIPLLLWQQKLISQPYFYISSYFENRKEEYIGLMRNVSHSGEWNKWVSFFLRGTSEVAKENLILSKKILSLYDEMKGVFTEILKSTNTLPILDYIFSNPIYTNAGMADTVGIAPNTAARVSRLLQSKGLLGNAEEQAGSRATLYSFDSLVNIVKA